MLDRCQTDIYENGTQVFLTHTIAAKDLDPWVQKIAEDSGQPVDWHYAGGRAIILALGDLEKVKTSLKKLRPEHDELYRKASAVYLGDKYDCSRTLDGLWRYSDLA